MKSNYFKKISVIILIIAVLPIFDYTPLRNSGIKFVKYAEARKKYKKYRRYRRRRARTFALNFKDVEISEFVNIMSKLTGKNIILSDRVRGKITIISPRKIPVYNAFNIMKSILEVKGFAVVRSGNLYKIVRVREAIKQNVEIYVDGKKLRTSSKGKDIITYLYKLKNADSSDILNALRPLKSRNTNIVVYQPTNTLILSGIQTEINGLIEIAKQLDKKVEGPGGQTGNIHVVHLENAVAEDLANVLSRVPFSETAKINTSPLYNKRFTRKTRRRTRRSRRTRRIIRNRYIKSKKKSKLSIIPNKATNSLIITATPAEFRQILRVIKQLDIVRQQVLIEAMIVEVSVENGWGLGIDWMLGQKSGTHLFGGSSIMGNTPDYSTGTVNGKQLVMPLSTGFQVGYLSDTSMLGFALLNASGKDNKFNILSTPQILTIDNNEAELNVGEEIPVPSNNRISESGTQFFTYDYKSVGIKLKITPHITQKKRITLDLYQEVNSVIGSTINIDPQNPPTLSKRDIKTKVTVLDGHTIVVGGLIRNNKSRQVTKVPILGDIPLLGYLFKRETIENKKTNLLIFITPHIVTKQKKLDAITRQKREIQKRLMKHR